MIACGASIAAITAELGLAKSAHGLMKIMHVSLAGVTVAVSWFVMQLVFALHYAHHYYSPDDLPGARGRARGLNFPGRRGSGLLGLPALLCGDRYRGPDRRHRVRVQAPRRIGTVHSLIAFTFNTVVLALSINLLASLA
jgi:uncharacterized membrane protein